MNIFTLFCLDMHFYTLKMLGNCWLVKKLPNYLLFLTNSSPEAFTNLWQFTLHNCWAYIIIYQQYFLNLVGNLLPRSWISLTVFSFMLGKLSWAMKGWSKIIYEENFYYIYRSLPIRVGNICTQYRAKFKSNSWAIDTVYVYLSSNAVSIAQLVG